MPRQPTGRPRGRPRTRIDPDVEEQRAVALNPERDLGTMYVDQGPPDTTSMQLAAMNDQLAKLQMEMGRIADRVQAIEKRYGLPVVKQRR